VLPPLTKRRFLKLAGLSISNRVVGHALPPANPSASNKVILVTFGGGVRYSETFAPEGQHNIPRLVSLRPQGHFFANCVNSGVLSHFNSTASIVTGNWQRVDDFGFQPPAGATLFEQFRKQTGAGPLDAWAVATNKSFAQMGSGSDRSLGAPYGANVVLPKQLLLEAVQDVVKKPAAGGVADRDAVLERLESVLAEGYEGVGWTIFKAGRQLDRHVRETLTRGLIEYINGPEAPTSGDELTFFLTREIMREFSPRLILVNFWDMDVAHWGSYSLYLNAITKTDRLTGMLWDEVESNANYRGKTTMLVLPELGRDGDVNASNGFLNHRSGDPSCRNMWLLALGAGVPRGETDRTVHHVDVAATAAALLGVKAGEMSGTPMRELLL
jgi:hypothetical protein